ncbi:MAG: pyrroline-5-carboxylate reductase [Pseudomonadota bacterium]
MRLGFIGTGTITAAIVRGLKASDARDWPVVLSPRSADIARSLAALPGVAVAESNEAAIEGAETVVLAVRPQVAEAVLRPLRIRHEQQVVSLIAATPARLISEWTGARQVCRAIPLPFVEARRDVTPVFPPHPPAMRLFDALGTALPVEDQASFDLYAALSALMGSYFQVLETASAWAEAHGLPPGDARAYLTGLFDNLGRVARKSPRSLSELRSEHSTAGGLNEQAAAEFVRHGGAEALAGALEGVLRRICGRQ